MPGSKCPTVPRIAAIVNAMFQCAMVPPLLFMYFVCAYATANLHQIHLIIENGKVQQNNRSQDTDLVTMLETHKMNLGALEIFVFTTGFLTLVVLLGLYAAHKLLAATKPGIFFYDMKKNLDMYRSAVGKITALTIIVAATYLYKGGLDTNVLAIVVFHFIPLLLQSIGMITMYFLLRMGGDTKVLVAAFERQKK